jgi:hypothetical protein
MTYDELVSKIKKLQKTKDVGLVIKSYGSRGRGVTVSRIEDNRIVCKDMDGTQCINNPERQAEYGGAGADAVLKIIPLKKGTNGKIDKTRDDKRPRNKDNHIGVEIEFISKLAYGEIEMLMADAGLENSVTVKEDGSVNSSTEFPHAHEICLIATEKDIKKLVKKVCKLIAPHSSVNKTCGLHVHLDMRKRNTDKTYANLFAAQPLLYGMCPKSRVNGSYSCPVSDYEPFSERDGYDDDRYVGINHTAYEKHDTFEVRIHAGTVSETKINNWIKLLIKIADSPVKSVSGVDMWKNFKQGKRKIKLSGNLEKYVQKRLDKFKKHHENTEFSDFMKSA